MGDAIEYVHILPCPSHMCERKKKRNHRRSLCTSAEITEIPATVVREPPLPSQPATLLVPHRPPPRCRFSPALPAPTRPVFAAPPLLRFPTAPVRCSPLLPTFFFLFIHYSRATCGYHGEDMYSPFPVRCPRSGGSLQAPLCPPPTPVPRTSRAHQGDYKRKREERRLHRP